MTRAQSTDIKVAVDHRRPTDDADAYTVTEFCLRHRISVAFFYKLLTKGIGPATFRVGSRVLISKEAAGRWRAEREAATSAADA